MIKIFLETYKRSLEEPICRKFNGFVGAFDKFLQKRLKSRRLKKIITELKNMKTRHDDLFRLLSNQKILAVQKRREYISQMELVKRKLNGYEHSSYRTDANKRNSDYDFDYLKMLQCITFELREKHVELMSALKDVELLVKEFVDQRISWSEYLIDIIFYHKPQKKSFF